MVGIGGVGAGTWGLVFIHASVAGEKIVIPDDAAFGGQQLRWPWQLKAQVDVIREHTLKTTGGKTYAEMPRTVPKLDVSGQPVLDEKGESVMVPNTARDLWITATTLTTALNLGIVGYLASAFTLFFGVISCATGYAFLLIRKRFV